MLGPEYSLLILPANMSNIFQPLNVDFFNTLKLACHQQVDNYQLESTAASVPKAFFYPWLQRAWTTTANTRQIRRAWAKSGLFPLDQAMMGAMEMTPEPARQRSEPERPRRARTVQAIDRQVQEARYHQSRPSIKYLRRSSE